MTAAAAATTGRTSSSLLLLSTTITRCTSKGMARSGSLAAMGHDRMSQSCSGVGSACSVGHTMAGGVGLKGVGMGRRSTGDGFGGLGYLLWKMRRRPMGGGGATNTGSCTRCCNGS